MSSHHNKAFIIRHHNQADAKKARKREQALERAEKYQTLKEFYAEERRQADMQNLAWTGICLLYFVGIVVALAAQHTIVRLLG